jgi:hypothetical protein
VRLVSYGDMCWGLGGSVKWEQVLARLPHRFQPQRSAEDLSSRYLTITRAEATPGDPRCGTNPVVVRIRVCSC